jgi:hypothetical protein
MFDVDDSSSACAEVGRAKRAASGIDLSSAHFSAHFLRMNALLID